MNMPLEPELVLEGGMPIQRQIADQLRQFIQRGLLRPGEAIPTVREVAVGLAIQPGAVMGAYHELATAGLIDWDGGAGPTVAGAASGNHVINGEEPLTNICFDLLARATRLGYSAQDVLHTLTTMHQGRSQS